LKFIIIIIQDDLKEEMEDVLTTTEERETVDQFIEISVEEPQKIGDGMNSFLAYK
jgi:sorting nexin-1/2